MERYSESRRKERIKVPSEVSGEAMKHRSRVRFILEGIEGVGVTLAVLLTWPVSRYWLRNWGSLPEERERSWPGDEFVLPRHSTYTRAIDVTAPAPDVWPWNRC